MAFRRYLYRRSLIWVILIGLGLFTLLTITLNDIQTRYWWISPVKVKRLAHSVFHPFHSNPAQNSLINQPNFPPKEYHCKKDGILTIKAGGRLGNLMGEYATLWALSKRDHFFPVIQQRAYETLTKYFRNTSIPTVSNLNCQLKWNMMKLGTYNLLNKGLRKKLAKEGIFIDGYPTSVSLFNRYRKEITEEFQFLEPLKKRAYQELERLGGNQTKNTVFIGVHVRRTDYSQFLQGRFNAKLVGPLYFSRAMDYYRQKFSSRALFVVASDDMDWCRIHLSYGDVVFAGNSDIDNPAQDMALLAACNHSIFTYGNFGFWSSYLAGGEVILAGNISSTPTELMHSIENARLSNWKFLPGF